MTALRFAAGCRRADAMQRVEDVATAGAAVGDQRWKRDGNDRCN
jgi:hypothetical protein